MKEQESILNDQTGNKFVYKNEQLIETEIIKDTPFLLVTMKDQGSFISLGQARLTEVYDTKDEAIQKININDWYFLLSVIYGMIRETPSFEKFVNEAIEPIETN